MKRIIILISTFISIISITIIFIKNNNSNIIAIYLDNVESTSIPDKDSNYIVDNIICDKDVTGTWDNDNWGILVTNISKKTNCKLYFRSKKDVTITYDNNYIKNNIIDEIYNLIKLSANALHSSNTKYSISKKNGFNYYKFTSGDDEASIDGSAGFYKGKNTLTAGTKYTLRFIAKGNKNFGAFIASEQDPYLYNSPWNITTGWQKYQRTFTAISNGNYKSFVIYGWLNGSEKRILELTNIELQEGEYDNFSTIVLKENDSLGNTLPTPSRDGYTFLGWYTDQIEGEKISNNTVVSENATYYAHWQYVE